MYRMIAKIVMSIPSLRKYLLDELGCDRYGIDYLEMKEYVMNREEEEIDRRHYYEQERLRAELEMIEQMKLPNEKRMWSYRDVT